MPDYYAFTTGGVDAHGVLLAVLQQPPATADLASSARLIFCISDTFLVIDKIGLRAIPRIVKRQEY
jgi:hypothetical protein